MFAMCTDNIFWISSSPEYEKFKSLGLFKSNGTELLVEGKSYVSKIDYIFRYRVYSVLKDYRDIMPALITSGIMTLIQSII